MGFGHRSGQVWALGGVHDRGERREAAHEAAVARRRCPPRLPLGPVRQRLRWIPPGRFLMGSPPDEEGRYSCENHNTRSRSPKASGCSTHLAPRALEALMVQNPSEFQSPNRPVENVSWEDGRKFVETLEFPGLKVAYCRFPRRLNGKYAVARRRETTRLNRKTAMPSRGTTRTAEIAATATMLQNGRNATPRGQEEGKSLGLVRHAGECLGVVQGCLDGRLY